MNLNAATTSSSYVSDDQTETAPSSPSRLLRWLSVGLLLTIPLFVTTGCTLWLSVLCAIELGNPEVGFNPVTRVCETQPTSFGTDRLSATALFGGASSAVPAKTGILGAGELFWSEDNTRIVSTIFAGDAVRKIVDVGRLPAGVDVARSTGEVYWTDLATGTIRRASLDGSDETVLQSDLSESTVDDQERYASLTDVAVDEAGGKVYWGNVSEGAIQRSNLDGSGLETIVAGLIGPTAIEVDPSGGKIYWTHLADAQADQKIQSANLDGSGVEDLLTGLSLPQDLALDVDAGTMYWTDLSAGTIRRANLDGSQATDILTGLDTPGGLVIDTSANQLYWGSVGGSEIQRANLDGSSLESVATFVDAAGLALDPTENDLYWASWIDGTLKRIDLDTQNSRQIAGPSFLSGSIALDEDREFAYWLGAGGSVQRASVDGSNQTELVGPQTGFRPVAIDVDLAGGQVYFAVSSFTTGAEIRRIDNDGANLQTVLSGLGSFVSDMVIDPDRGTVYWTVDEFGNRSIQQANLDGTQRETFYTPPGGALIRGLSYGDDQLAWVLNGNVVQRSDLTTMAGAEDVVTIDTLAVQATEVADGKVYWALDGQNTATIQRSNVDGSNIEDVVADLPAGSIGDLVFFGAGVIPVELASIEARVDGRDVVLAWQTLSETDNAGFDVQMQADRIEAAGGWESVAFVEGAGTTTMAQDYRVRVRDLEPGTYRFRLRQIDVDGAATLSSVVTATVEPERFVALSDPAPHPVQTVTRLTLTLREAQHVRAVLYDLLGRPVTTLHDGVLPAGTDHRLTVDGRDLASGVYFVRVEGETFRETRRLVRVR